MEINDYITGAFSLIAIVISIVGYIQKVRKESRELRIEKLEEMLEITYLLNGNYQYFEDTLFLNPNF